MPVCPAGTEIKPEILEDEFWLTIGDALQQLEDMEFIAPDVTQFLGSILNTVIPSRIDLNELCATEPDPVPEINFAALILSGEWRRASTAWPAWVIAAWKRNYWNSFCQCVPVAGPGTCPPVTYGPVTVSGSRVGGAQVLAVLDAPYGWTTSNFTATRTTDANPVGAELSFDFRDAGGLLEGTSNTSRIRIPASGGTSNSGNQPIGGTGNTNDVRQVRAIFVPQNGTSGQNNTTYTYTLTWAWTFAGTCQDIIGPPPTPPPLPPPLVIDTPVPVLGPDECTLSTICSMLQALTLTVANIQASQSEHIVMDSDTNSWVHAHLPVVIPPIEDLIGPPGPQGEAGPAGPQGIPGTPGLPGEAGAALEYSKGETFGPLIGASSVAIGDLVGVQVDVSQRPAGGLELEGQPAYLWNMGWLSILNVDGMLAEKRITREGMVWLPREMPLATSLTWTLREGVEIYLTELLPVTA